MTTRLEDLVKQFHSKFGFNKDSMTLEKLLLKLSQAHEEVKELDDAICLQEPEEIVDALIDQIYIAIGTLDLLGIDIQKAFLEVHMCNMAKERGVKTERDYALPNGEEYDVIKPKGWVAPNHSDNLGIIPKLYGDSK